MNTYLAWGPSFWRGLRHGLPVALALLWLLLTTLPVFGGYAQQLGASLLLAQIYYWTIHRPDLMPAAAVIALGILYDILWGAVPGLTALCWIAVQQLMLRQRDLFASNSFLLHWAGFWLLGLLVLLVQALCHWLLAGQPTAWPLALLLWLHGGLLFPLLASLLMLQQRHWLGAGDGA